MRFENSYINFEKLFLHLLLLHQRGGKKEIITCDISRSKVLLPSMKFSS
jgi:hypothetical protein